MELSELRAFVKIVQLGSITRAAAALGTGKAQMSRTLSGLETALGVRLVQRTTRVLRPTDAGREMLARAEAILAAVEEAEHAARSRLAAPTGRLRLTCGAEFGMLRVNAWITRYLAAYPAVSVEVEYTSRIVDLVHEGFDLAIRLGEPRDSGLAARRIGTMEYGFFASPAYLERRGTPTHPQGLGEHDLLMFNIGTSLRGWLLARGDATVEVAPRFRLGVNNGFALLDAARAGLGVARLPLPLAEDAVRAGALRRILPDWQTPGIGIHAVFPSRRQLSPAVRAFIDLAAGGGA